MSRTPKQPPHHDYEKKMKVRYLNGNESLMAYSLECSGIKAVRVVCNFVQNLQEAHDFVISGDKVRV